jgi:hypothetical protein
MVEPGSARLKPDENSRQDGGNCYIKPGQLREEMSML